MGRIHIGVVDAGPGHDESVMGGDDGGLPPSSDPAGGLFGEDLLSGRFALRFGRGHLNQLTLGLGHDLAGHDENVAIPQPRRGCRDDLG